MALSEHPPARWISDTFMWCHFLVGLTPKEEMCLQTVYLQRVQHRSSYPIQRYISLCFKEILTHLCWKDTRAETNYCCDCVKCYSWTLCDMHSHYGWALNSVIKLFDKRVTLGDFLLSDSLTWIKSSDPCRDSRYIWTTSRISLIHHMGNQVKL